MTNKRTLEDNLNGVFNCKDIHVHEVRDVDSAELTQLLITNSNFSLRIQSVKNNGYVFFPIVTLPKISMANLGRAMGYIEEYFDERS